LEKLYLNKSSVPEYVKIAFKEDMIKLFNNFIDINYKITGEYAQFNKKLNLQTPHLVLTDLTKNNQIGPYRTTYAKSILEDNYGLDPLVNKFTQKEHTSTILIEKIENLKFTSSYKKLNMLPIIKGAISDGYSQGLVSDKFSNAINEMEIFKFEIINTCQKYQIEAEDEDIITLMMTN